MQGAALLCIYKVRPSMTQVDNNSINEQCQSNRHQMAVILWHKLVILLHEISKKITVN